MGKCGQIIISFLVCFSIWGSELIEDFDLRSYDPVKNGLKDFYAELRIDGLAENLKKQLVNITVNDDVYFKVYWLYPGKVNVEVVGIVGDFKEIKARLKMMCAPALGMLIPIEYKKKLRSYKTSSENTNDGVVVKAIDPTQLKDINKIELKFNKLGKLESTKAFSSQGLKVTNLKYKKHSWSKNKWTLTEIHEVMKSGTRTLESETQIKYENIVGVGLPVNISTETQRFVSNGETGEKTLELESNIVYMFSEHKVNKAVAQKYFRAMEK